MKIVALSDPRSKNPATGGKILTKKCSMGWAKSAAKANGAE